MTTLDNGIVIDETITAHNYTPDAKVPATFGGYDSIKHGATIHHWGLDGQDFDGVVAYLASNNARGSSAHIVLQEDRVACIVSPDDAAWHAGHPLGNAQTIGIECRPEMTEGDLDALASLLRYLETIYGSLTIYKHQEWVATACPGRYAGRIDEIVAEINNVNVSTIPAVPITPATPVHACCCHD
jgi:N-acetylmuramoyl-L-alanine amidase